jgi:CRISPR type III-A-associated RAMP protein Csm4
MNPGLVVKLRPAGPWRIGPDSGARNRVDAIYHSDSLYSAVTSAMSRMGSLDAWLDATARSQTPAVCFSSCFPFLDDIGFVVPPRTIWPPTSPQAMSARVRWKSARFIPLSVVESILSGKKLNENQWSVDGASGCLVPAGKAGPFRTSVRWNAAVDRLSGSSERHATACIEFREGCGLWTVAGFHDEAARNEWQDRVKAAFRLLADTGFGGERSRGWGRSETPEFVEGTLPGLIIEYRRKEARAAGVEPGPELVSASASESEGAAPELVPVASPSLESEAIAPETEPEVDLAAALASALEAAAAEPKPDEPVNEAVAGPAPEADAAAGPLPTPAGYPGRGSDGVAPEAEPVAEPAPEGAAPEVAPITEIVPEAAAPETEPVAEPAPEVAAAETVPAPIEDAAVGSPEETRPQAGVGRLKPAPRMQEDDSPVVAQAVSPANLTAPGAEGAPIEDAAVGSLEETRPQAGVGRLKPAPPLQENDVPVVAQAVSPANFTAPEAAVPETEPAAESAPGAEGAPVGDGAAGSGEEMRPQAGVGRLKPAPPLQENDVPVVAQAVSPADLTAPTEAAVRAPDRTEPMRVTPPSVPLQAHWLLSLFTPAAEDAVDWGRGSYAVLARGGRIDSPSGSGELKKQIQMVAEGSVLFSDGVPLGAAPDVAPDGFAHPVFRAGFALAIRLPEVH